MVKHGTDIDTMALVGIRILRAGCLEWEDHTDKVDLNQQIYIPKEKNMRVKCISCHGVNAISAHEGDEGEIGWGCESCGTMQIIIPASLDQFTYGESVEEPVVDVFGGVE